MSKRVTRKTIQGKQAYKDSTSQTQIPERIITRNGPNFLEQGANLVGMMNCNPLVKLGANIISDLCDDTPFQSPVQKMKKNDSNPVKESICNQVEKINDQVQEIIRQNVNIKNGNNKNGALINERNIEIREKPIKLTEFKRKPSTFELPEDYEPNVEPEYTVKSRDLEVVDPFPESNNDQAFMSSTPLSTKSLSTQSCTTIEKYSFLPSISKQVIYDKPSIETQNVENKNKRKITRTITGRIDPTSIAYNRRMQAKRDKIMRDRNLKPIFQPPNIYETPKIDPAKYPSIPEVASGCLSTNPYKALDSYNNYKNV